MLLERPNLLAHKPEPIEDPSINELEFNTQDLVVIDGINKESRYHRHLRDLGIQGLTTPVMPGLRSNLLLNRTVVHPELVFKPLLHQAELDVFDAQLTK